MIIDRLFRRFPTVLCLVWAVLLCPLPAGAQDLPPVDLPAIDLHVYIDRSRSVYDPKNEKSPHRAILDMIKALADQPTGTRSPLIRQGSTITTSSFGDGIRPATTITVGSDREELSRSIDRLRDLGTHAGTTDFAPAFKDILSSMEGWKAHEENLQVVLIASDFVQEELPGLRQKKGKNGPGSSPADACDYLDFSTGPHIDRFAEPLVQLGNAVRGWNDSRSLPIVFIGLRVKPAPTYLGQAGKTYRDCFNRAFEGQWVLDRMKGPTTLSSLDYDSLQTQLPDLVKRLSDIVATASSQGPAIDPNNSRCLRDTAKVTLDCTITVVNHGTQDRVIEKVVFSAPGGGTPVDKVPPNRPIVAKSNSRSLSIALEGAAAQPFMRSEGPLVNLVADKPFRPKPVRIDFAEDRGLELTGTIEATRSTADRNYAVTLDLRNAVDKKRKPDAISFSEQPNGSAPFARTVIPGDQGYLSNDQKVSIPLELGREATEALESGRARYVILHSSDEAGAPGPVKAVPLKVRRYAPVVMMTAFANSVDGEDWGLRIEARSPDQSGRTVNQLSFTERAGRVEVAKIDPPAAVELPQSGGNLSFSAPAGLAQALNEGRALDVAIIDGQSGKPSTPIKVTRETPARNLLAPVSARVEEVNQDQLKIRLQIRSGSKYPAAVTELKFLSTLSDAEPVSVRLPEPMRFNGGGPVNREQTVDIDRKALGKLAELPTLMMRPVDANGVESQGQVRVENLPGKQRLRVIEAKFGPASESDPAIAIAGVIHNPSSSQTTVTGIRPAVTSRSPAEAALSLSPQLTVPGGENRPFTLVLPSDRMADFPPTALVRAMLVEQGLPANGPSAEAFEIAPLERVSLELRSAAIEDGKLSLTVVNKTKVRLHLKSVWLAPSSIDADKRREVLREPPEPIAPNGQPHKVLIPLTSQENAILKPGGVRPDTIWICARTELEAAIGAGVNCAPAADGSAKVPKPTALRAVLTGDPSKYLEGRPARIKLGLVNPGEVANEARAVEFWGAEGDASPRPLGTLALSERVIVQPEPRKPGGAGGGVMAFTQVIGDDLFGKAYGYEKLWLCPVDETRSAADVAKHDPDNCGRIFLDYLSISPVDMQIQNVQLGYPNYKLIRGKIRIERMWDYPMPQGLSLTARLKPSPDGKERLVKVALPNGMPSSRVEEVVAWQLSGDVKISEPTLSFSDANFPANTDRTYPLAAEQIDIKVNFVNSLFIAGGLFLVFVIAKAIYNKKFNMVGMFIPRITWKSAKNAVEEGKYIVNMISYVINLMPIPVLGIGGISLTALFGWMRYETSLATFFWSFLVFLAILFVFGVIQWGLVTRSSKKHVESGNKPAPYPLFVRTRVLWGFVPAATVAAMLIVGVSYWWADKLRPYDPHETPHHFIESAGGSAGSAVTATTSTQTATMQAARGSR